MSLSPKVNKPMAEKEASVVAIFTTYFPNQNLKRSVQEALKQCSKVIIADNTPEGELNARQTLGSLSGVEITENGRNIGLANGLNAAIKLAENSEFFFFLDQDSSLQPGIVSALKKILTSNPGAGAVGPAPWDELNSCFIDPRTSYRPQLASLPVIITSAMMLRTKAYNDTSGFRNDFFVDCVDQDMCLQLRKKGWDILQDKSILLPHRLGEMRWHKIGAFKFRATHHPTWRLYWMARNGILLTRENLRFDFKWSLTNLALLLYSFLTIGLFEKPRLINIKVFFLGIFDGFLGRSRESYLPPGARKLRN